MTSTRILIVEDESITAEYLQAVLTDLGYSVTAIVSSGDAAIGEAERNNPDLVLMDIRIKGKMDGVEAARIIRRRFDIPSVYLTAHADLETLSRAKLAKPLGYIVKPFQVPELQATIEMAMHKRQLDREAKQREEQLSATLAAMGEAVIWSNANGVVTFLNPAAQKWTEWKHAEAVGRRIEEVLRLRPSGAERVFSQVLSEGKLASLDETVLIGGQDDAERAIGGTAAPIVDHSGVAAGVVFVFGEPAREFEGIPGLPDAATDQDGFAMIVESAAMRRLVSFARRVAKSEASTILIEGESGTGKDVLARYVHYHSSRGAQPFFAVNCAAIPETLLESELFGYEKGAFTDARQQKRGILELASGGTVFLDEVGEMPLGIQAKLLRVLEEQAFRRLGGLTDIKVDLRVVTATNQDLRAAIQNGRFRLDLYYRVNVIQLTIPPLRERKEEILPLANHFLRSLNTKFKRHIQGFSPHAVEAMLAHNWPGNAREVRNTVERAMILEEGLWIQTSSLDIRRSPAMETQPQANAIEPLPDGMSLGDAERAMLMHALEKANWNQSRAARALRITRDTLRYRMKKYGLLEAAAAAG